MKKLLLLVIPLNVIFTSCQEETQLKTVKDFYQEEIQPKTAKDFLLDKTTKTYTDQNEVTSTVETSYEYLENHNINKIRSVSSSQQNETTVSHYYNPNDLLASTTIYYTGENEPASATHYLWDDLGRLYDKQIITSKKIDGTKFTITDNNHFSCEGFDENGSTGSIMNFEFDYANNTIIGEHIKDGMIERRITYVYDEQIAPYSLGNLSYLGEEETDLFGLTDNNLLLKTEEFYDEDLKIWKNIIVIENHYIYNDFGLPTSAEQTVHFTPEMILISNRKTDFEYIEKP